MDNAWIAYTDRCNRYDRVDRGFSYGGASLQACVLVLLFAAAVSARGARCPGCGLWHNDFACEAHAPWTGEGPWEGIWP